MTGFNKLIMDDPAVARPVLAGVFPAADGIEIIFFRG